MLKRLEILKRSRFQESQDIQIFSRHLTVLDVSNFQDSPRFETLIFQMFNIFKKRCLVHLLDHGVDLTLRMRTSGLRIFNSMLMTMDVQYSRLKTLGSVVMVLEHACAP